MEILGMISFWVNASWVKQILEFVQDDKDLDA
jgi:hypothetical protein